MALAMCRCGRIPTEAGMSVLNAPRAVSRFTAFSFLKIVSRERIAGRANESVLVATGIRLALELLTPPRPRTSRPAASCLRLAAVLPAATPPRRCHHFAGAQIERCALIPTCNGEASSTCRCSAYLPGFIVYSIRIDSQLVPWEWGATYNQPTKR